MKYLIFLFVILFTSNVVCQRRIAIKKIAHCHEEVKPLVVLEPTIVRSFPNGTLIINLLVKIPTAINDDDTMLKWQLERETKPGQFQKILNGADETGLCKMLNKYIKKETIEMETALGMPNPGSCPIGKGTWRLKNYPIHLGASTVPPMIPSGNLKFTAEAREKSTNKVVYCLVSLISI